MSDENSNFSEEILQRYHDGELGREECEAVEARLASDPEARRRLEELQRLSKLLGLLGAACEPDVLAAARNWDTISRTLPPGRKLLARRTAYWLSLAAAAALLIFFLEPRTGKASNDLVIETIDCTYSSFMVLCPESDDGHTIIWINDSRDSQN